MEGGAGGAVLTCGVGELLLADLLQLEDLLQGLWDLGPADAHLLALPHLEWKRKRLVSKNTTETTAKK